MNHNKVYNNYNNVYNLIMELHGSIKIQPIG